MQKLTPLLLLYTFASAFGMNSSNNPHGKILQPSQFQQKQALLPNESNKPADQLRPLLSTKQPKKIKSRYRQLRISFHKPTLKPIPENKKLGIQKRNRHPKPEPEPEFVFIANTIVPSLTPKAIAKPSIAHPQIENNYQEHDLQPLITPQTYLRIGILWVGCATLYCKVLRSQK